MMMDVLQFAFQGFWHFVGVGILVGLVGQTIVETARAIRGKYPPREEKDDSNDRPVPDHRR